MVPAWDLPGRAAHEGRRCRPATRRSSCTCRSTHDDIAFLQYTGGTTGVAKGAMLLHRNIVANLLQARAWLKPFLDPNQREIVITPLPLYHIFSLTANCLVFMTARRRDVLIPNPRDIPGFVKEMAQVQVHGVHRRQYAVQRARQQCGLREARFLRVCASPWAAAWRCRRPSRRSGGRSPASADRGVRAHRDVAGGDDQPARPSEVQRRHRLADLVDRGHAARRRRERRRRWGSRARSASVVRR